MITRAQIRRQLRKEGGILNAVPRQKYGIGSWAKERIRKLIPKELAKVATVAAPFVAPFNPAIAAGMMGLGSFQQTGRLGSSIAKGLGTYGLGQLGRTMGGAGRQWGLKAPGAGTGFKSYFSSPLSAGKSASLFGTPRGSIGPSLHGTGKVAEATQGILGKLGLTKGGGSMKMTPLGMISGASLLTYFMQKGSTEDEATQLAQDVYRGKGLGLDLIKKDIAKYRTGDLSASQMFDKGYHFLTPRDYIGAKGGRVNFNDGSLPFSIEEIRLLKKFKYNPSQVATWKDKGKDLIKTLKNPNLAKGGRVKYQTGGVSMDKTLAENIAANKAQAAGIENILAQGRSRLPGYTGATPQASDEVRQPYVAPPVTPIGPMTPIAELDKIREQVLKEQESDPFEMRLREEERLRDQTMPVPKPPDFIDDTFSKMPVRSLCSRPWTER